MEVTINKGELEKLLYLTESIVQKKTTMPILQNLLLSADNGQLRSSASDLEISAVARAQAKVTSAGSITVNAKVFGGVVRELPDGDIQFKVVDGDRLELKAGKSKLKIIGVSAQEYPSLAGLAYEVKGKINSKQLVEMINKTVYAVSMDENRFNLSGVCFDLVKENKGAALRLAATDGHRIALITRAVDDIDFNGPVIVPRKGLVELKKLLDSVNNTQVGFGIEGGFVILETPTSKMSVRLVDGEFPDYTQVIPKQKGAVAIIPGTEFSQALRRVVLLVVEKNKCVRLDFSNSHLRISSSSPELGEAQEELEITYKGQPLSIGFNAIYLLDVAASIGENQPLQIELNGELGPGKFGAENDESYMAIVMPMRIG